LYLDLASFVSSYLEHQDMEERVVMPALEQAIGVEAVIGIHGAILGSIPPDELMRSLALMLPAMNVDDRTELLGGMRAAAPPEAFAAVVASPSPYCARPTLPSPPPGSRDERGQRRHDVGRRAQGEVPMILRNASLGEYRGAGHPGLFVGNGEGRPRCLTTRWPV